MPERTVARLASTTSSDNERAAPILFQLPQLRELENVSRQADDQRATEARLDRMVRKFERRPVPASIPDVEPSSWLDHHATDLIDRLTDWSMRLDQREAELESREQQIRSRTRELRRKAANL